jgi:hypothetical protein
MIRLSWRELGVLEQVGEAVRVQDHRDQVRRVGLVEVDQARRQQALALGELDPQPGQPRALGAEVALDGRQPRELAVEVGLEPGLLGLEHGDVGLERADAVRVAADVRGQHALLGALSLDLALFLLDARGQ